MRAITQSFNHVLQLPFSLRVLPAPTSTLFPYTTLFRSPFTDEKHIFANLGDGTYYHSGILAIRAAVAAKVDRKSTRLNSSHLGISYAVFCLKKKRHPNDVLYPAGRSAGAERRLDGCGRP